MNGSTSFIFGLATLFPLGVMIIINGILLRLDVIFSEASYPFSLQTLNLGYISIFVGCGFITVGIIMLHFYLVEREKERIWLEYTKEGLKKHEK